jgi:hypothetical protein
MIRPSTSGSIVVALALLTSCAPSEASAIVGEAAAPVSEAASSHASDDVPADPRALRRGRIYRTSAPAPSFVMPRRTGPPDRTLPAQTVFRVEEIMEKAPPWYEITIFDIEGRAAGRAYVDAKDLLGQQIVELRPAGEPGDVNRADGVRVDPRRLERELSYRLTASCPIVNEPAASAPELMLPERSVVRVVEIREKAPPWYRVEVLDEDGAIARRGWIDAAALLESEVLLLSAPRDAYELVGIEPADTGATTRRIVRIRVPLGRTQPILEGTLLGAAQTVAAETKAERVMVLAYLPHDDATGPHTVGRAVYAPGGRWDGAATGGPRAVIDLGRGYFEASEWPETLGPGDTVALSAPNNAPLVTMNREADPTSASVPVPADTEVTVLARRAIGRTPDDYDVRYQVRIQLGARTVEGWVDALYVEGE